MTSVASRELRNDTAGVLRRVAAGEPIEITVNGRAVARLSRLAEARSHWTPRSEFVAQLPRIQADSGLAAGLEALAGDVEGLGPIL